MFSLLPVKPQENPWNHWFADRVNHNFFRTEECAVSPIQSCFEALQRARKAVYSAGRCQPGGCSGRTDSSPDIATDSRAVGGRQAGIKSALDATRTWGIIGCMATQDPMSKRPSFEAPDIKSHQTWFEKSFADLLEYGPRCKRL
jgi:hypothetical protein